MTFTGFDVQIAVFLVAAALLVAVLRRIVRLWPSVFPRRTRRDEKRRGGE